MSDRMFGTFLTWLNDHESDIFTIATCNDIRALAAASSGAFARAERFDGMFFCDLPTKDQRQAIWSIHMEGFGLTDQQQAELPDDDGWTGAEISACCRLAALLDQTLVETSKQIVPVGRSSAEQITALKKWANNRCLSADWPGVYDMNGDPKYVTPESMGVGGKGGPIKRKVNRGVAKA